MRISDWSSDVCSSDLEDVAVRQHEDLARDLEVGRDRGDRESGGNGRRFTVPALGFRDLHRRHERLVDLWEFGIFARLVELLAAGAAGGKARRRGERCEEVRSEEHNV